jgi:hypothetical protein
MKTFSISLAVLLFVITAAQGAAAIGGNAQLRLSDEGGKKYKPLKEGT